MQLNSSKIMLFIMIILISLSVSYARDFRIINFELDRNIFFPGEVVEGTISIENRKDETQQYQLELIYNNKVFVQGTPRFLYSRQTAEQNFFLEVPDKESVWVTFRVYNEDYSTSIRRNILISSKRRTFSFNLDKNIEVLRPGETETFNVELYNKGTLDDTYSVKIENWEHFEIDEEFIKVEYYSSDRFSFDVFVPEDIRVGQYEIDLVICNIEDNCKTEIIELRIIRPEREQSIIEFDETIFERKFSRTGEKIEFNISVQNIGDAEKRYTIFIEKEETEGDLAIRFNEPEFVLDVDVSKEIVFELTPLERTDYTVYLVINSEGSRIYREKIELKHEAGFSAISGMFFSEDAGGLGGTGLILSFVLIIGIGGYLLFRYMQTNIWKEKAVDYTEKHPRKLTNHNTNYNFKGGI